MTETEILLKNQLSEIQIQLKTLVELNHRQSLIIEQQQHRIDQLLRQLYGKKSEKISAQRSLFDQSLFVEGDIETVVPEQKETIIAEHKRKERKKNPESLRQEFPEHLRREEVVIEPTEVPDGAVKIGEEVSEKLEITKSELYVKRTVRPKYALADKSGVVVADLPEAPIYRCMAGVSLLVYLVIAKYVDHLPLYRIKEKFARQRVRISDSTMGDWVSQVAKLLEILYKELENQVLSSHYLGADETTIRELDPKLDGKSHQGYLWVYLAHDVNLVLFDYDPSRKKEVVSNKLLEYTGYLQSDGYAGYEQFKTHKKITRVGCMAHARRKFDEAMKNDKKTALEAMTRMQRIYRLEHWLRVLQIHDDGKKKLREKIAVPMLNDMFDWMEQIINKTTPQSPIYKALQYSIKRRTELIAYTQDGKLHIDNNPVENKIRPTVIGKKNYLFMGSHDAAQCSAMIYSFLISCKANNINPEEWLEDVLIRINSTKKSELAELLPNRWKKATL
ncbi:MAG: IS66 family transposase [Flavobacteriales bacterium]|jgi:transposase